MVVELVGNNSSHDIFLSIQIFIAIILPLKRPPSLDNEYRDPQGSCVYFEQSRQSGRSKSNLISFNPVSKGKIDTSIDVHLENAEKNLSYYIGL